MSSTPQPLYPIFIKWMPYHIPILFLMYAFIIMKILNYFRIVEIGFQWQNKKSTYLNIILLVICYQFIITCIVYLYKKVISIKINTLKYTGKATIVEFEKHKKLNTSNQLYKLQRDDKFKQWKKSKIQKQQSEKMMPKIVYQVMQSSSSSSQEQIQRISEHRLATSKKIF